MPKWLKNPFKAISSWWRGQKTHETRTYIRIKTNDGVLYEGPADKVPPELKPTMEKLDRAMAEAIAEMNRMLGDL